MACERSTSLGERRLLPGLAVVREALRVAERRGDVRVVHHRGGLVAGIAQHARERRIEVDQQRVRLAVAALGGQPPGHQGDEAAARLGPVAVGLLEEDPASRQRVEVRAGGAPVAVGAQVIRPQRVDRHQQHVQAVARGHGARRRLRLLRASAWAGAAAGRQGSHEQQEAPQARSSMRMVRWSSPAWSELDAQGLVPGCLPQALRPFDRQHTRRTRQLLEPQLALVAVAAQPVEVGVVEHQPPGVGGEQHEGRARHLLGVGTQSARQTAHEGGLARAELARQQHDLAALEASGQLAGHGGRLGLAVAQELADGPPPARSRLRAAAALRTCSIASGSASTRSPATRPSSPMPPRDEIAGPSVHEGRCRRREQRPVARQQRSRHAGQHVTRSAGRHARVAGRADRRPAAGLGHERPLALQHHDHARLLRESERRCGAVALQLGGRLSDESRRARPGAA